MKIWNHLKDRVVQKLFTLLEAYRLKYEKTQLNGIPFKSLGQNCRIGQDYRISGAENMSIGDYFFALKRLRLEAITQFNGSTFSPKVIIGNHVVINNDVHIGCINRIEIGDHCLLASRIFISDHNHGSFSHEMLNMPPNDRPLVSKGPVIINNNVWIGEGAAILGNVTIGENSIIATNAVVTKDIPPNSIVGGIPARIIKQLE